jgi:hypothetical protein
MEQEETTTTVCLTDGDQILQYTETEYTVTDTGNIQPDSEAPAYAPSPAAVPSDDLFGQSGISQLGHLIGYVLLACLLLRLCVF